MPTETETETRNVATMERVYAAVPAGDLDTALSLLDPEVTIVYYGSDATPYTGEYHGIDGAVEFFTRVGTHIEIVEMEVHRFIVQGDELAAFGRQRFRRLANGHVWESDFAHIVTLRDGRWLEFRDFMNSALTHLAFTET